MAPLVLPGGQVRGQRWFTAPPGHRLPAGPIEIVYFELAEDEIGTPVWPGVPKGPKRERFVCYASEPLCQSGFQTRCGRGDSVEAAYEAIFRDFRDGPPIGPWLNPGGHFFVPVDPVAAAKRVKALQRERRPGAF